jgi:hypothetical protein
MYKSAVLCACAHNLYGPYKRSISVSLFIYCTVTYIPVVRIEVFTAVTMKNAVSWDATGCGSCNNRRFGGTYHLHHRCNNLRARNNVPRLLVAADAVSSSPILVALMLEAIHSSETSILARATLHNTLEDILYTPVVRETSKEATLQRRLTGNCCKNWASNSRTSEKRCLLVACEEKLYLEEMYFCRSSLQFSLWWERHLEYRRNIKSGVILFWKTVDIE